MNKTMKRLLITLLMLALLLAAVPAALANSVVSSNQLPYVIDMAALLSDSERTELENEARALADQYGCAVYILTVDDYTDYYDYYDIYDCATRLYQDNALGYGSGHDGVMLMLSMYERDYALIAYGDTGNAAFTDYGKEVLSDNFLDDFSDDDWYGGFSDYLELSGDMLAQQAAGTPFDVDSDPSVLRTQRTVKLGVVLLLPAVIAFAVCAVFKAQMRSARLKTSAEQYTDAAGLDLQVRQDLFTHATTTRTYIPKSTPKSGGGGGGGGTTIRSGGFSGRSGKF